MQNLIKYLLIVVPMQLCTAGTNRFHPAAKSAGRSGISAMKKILMLNGMIIPKLILPDTKFILEVDKIIISIQMSAREKFLLN